jgi:bifunctional UDP-N-acetylglucosamine pyrophosphorylase/glucosamine-1-phosphate N-acetyltransferase
MSLRIKYFGSVVRVSFSVIVLAAGQGTRMNSAKPKVLQPLAGKPLLHHVLATVKRLTPVQTLVVCGYRGEELIHSCQKYHVEWAWQLEQRGTGHAVQMAHPALVEIDQVLVLYGDVPLVQEETLRQLLEKTPVDSLGILTARVSRPHGLGRIIRNKKQQVINIVEERDATAPQRKLDEINTGIYVLPYKYMDEWLSNLTAHNQQQEFYLTDLIAMAVEAGVPIVDLNIDNELEVAGINSQLQLAQVEREFQLAAAKKLMVQGVKVYDPRRLDIRGNVSCGQDVSIDVNVIFEGDVVIGNEVSIGPNVVIKDCTIEDGAVIHANSVLDSAIIGAHCQVGPFARIRPGTVLNQHSKIGNFVETKNTIIGADSKVNHLSYIGDAEVGDRVNIGAGVITCNYDGAHKHKTVIEDDAFIGSNCELVAPVTIGRGATLAAGTTLVKDAPAGALTLTKKILSNILTWQRPIKNKEEN